MRRSLQVSIKGALMLSTKDAKPASTFLMLRVEVRVLLPAVVLYSITRFCRNRPLGET